MCSRLLRLSACFVASAGLLWNPQAALAPAEQLVPADTLALFTIPDWDAAYATFQKSPQSKLWNDPSVKAFKEKFIAKLTESFLTPLERDLDIKVSDYTALLHGQLTVALSQNGWDGKSDQVPAFLFLLDAKDKKEALAKQLAELKKKWLDSGKQTKTEALRGVAFTTLVVNKEDIDKAVKKLLPAQKAKEKEEEPAKPETFEISFGQADSLLIVGTNPKAIENVLVHKSGGQLPTLADEAAYAVNHAAMFRNALGFAWVNFKPVYDGLSRKLAQAAPPNSDSPFAFSTDKILDAVGLNALKTIAVDLSAAAEGSTAEFFLGIPEANRSGIFRIFTPESKDAAPPSFVPADVTKFQRWRIDGKKGWATIETMIQTISPSLAGNLQMALNLIGKDKDPDFDLKKTFIGNLGDDFISYEKAPRSLTLTDLNAPPTLFLIGSGNPDKLGEGFKAAINMLPMAKPGSNLTDRDFLGRKIYSMPMRAVPTTETNAKLVERSLNFAASGGYLAVSTDAAMLEQFLRSSEASGRNLRETAGLNEAAQKSGGMQNGMFGYENQQLTMRSAFETLKSDKANFEKILAMAFNLPQIPGAPSVKEMFDVSLLPQFDLIAKYFSFVVYSGAARNDGLSWKFFSPTPPNLR